jgi:hypothetical protein
MNRKLKQVTVRESRASKLLSQGSSSSSSRQEAMLRCVHGEEEQRGEEEQGGEEECVVRSRVVRRNNMVRRRRLSLSVC